MTKEQMGIEAHKAVVNAIRNGLLVKPERCSKCGKKVLESRQMHGHHANYFNPLEVEWLCSRCHYKRHSFMRWFVLGFKFADWCRRHGVNPDDRHLPARHKQTGVPLQTSVLQHWLKGRRE